MTETRKIAKAEEHRVAWEISSCDVQWMTGQLAGRLEFPRIDILYGDQLCTIGYGDPTTIMLGNSFT